MEDEEGLEVASKAFSPCYVSSIKRKQEGDIANSSTKVKLDLTASEFDRNMETSNASALGDEDRMIPKLGHSEADNPCNRNELKVGTTHLYSESESVKHSEHPSTPLESLIQPSVSAPKKFVSSENFKLRITHLPHPISYGEARRLIQEKLKLKARKIKLTLGDVRKPSVIFATFENSERLEEALKAVDGKSHRGIILKANIVNTDLDPLPTAPQPTFQQNSNQDGGSRIPRDVIETVCPLQNTPYFDQLKSKQVKTQSIVDDIVKGIIAANPSFRSKKILNTPNDCMIVPQISLEVPLPLPSPVTEGYRNKCEFTCGYDAELQRTIGYRLTTYKKGCVNVGRVDEVSSVSITIQDTVKKFESFLRDSAYQPFDPFTNEGFYRTFTVRTTSSGQVMVMLTVSGGVLKAHQMNDFRNSIIQFYESPSPSDVSITSFYLKESEVHGQKERNQPVLLFGSETITEMMLDLKFEISPDSFFQVNTACAEVLYKTIVELASLNENTTLLDVCCGTGTIGIASCKLSDVGEVIGIESCESAVINARKNACVNNVSERCQFYTGRAETLIDASINSAKFSDLVAVVDPPRAGLTSSVVSVLRNCSRIKRIIYVACKLEACRDNLISFARPPSKKFRGECFVPEKIIPVDMFPHTPEIEILIVLKRKPN